MIHSFQIRNRSSTQLRVREGKTVIFTITISENSGSYFYFNEIIMSMLRKIPANMM